MVTEVVDELVVEEDFAPCNKKKPATEAITIMTTTITATTAVDIDLVLLEAGGSLLILIFEATFHQYLSWSNELKILFTSKKTVLNHSICVSPLQREFAQLNSRSGKNSR